MMSASFYIFSAGLIAGIALTILACRYFYTKRTLKLINAVRQLSSPEISHLPTTAFSKDTRILFHLIQRIISELKAKIFDTENERIKLTTILDSIAEGMIAVDAHLRILLINPSAQAIFKTSKDSAAGKSLLEVAKNETVHDMMMKAISEKVVLIDEIEISRQQQKVLRISAIGIAQSEDQKVCGILVLSDITEIRKLENVRRDFVANVSHELRTPLTSISGFIETLLSSPEMDPKRERYFLKLIEEDTSRLGRLIGDLLELSKIESKSIPLKLERTNLADEIQKAILSLEPGWKQRRIKIHNQVLENQMLATLVDRDKIKQVFLNLLDNAVKFNRDGGEIFIDGREHHGQIEIKIRDTGPGIPKELIPRVFERFFRVDKARSRELGGTGLGLAIVKHIIEAHGGTVACSSEIDHGSAFSFSIPLK